MDSASLKETIYTPESQLRKPKKLFYEMFSDLKASRSLAWRLFLRNISAQYRQTVLGYLWAFLPPLFTMAVWVYLNTQKVINIDNPGMPYPVYVLTGTVLWQTFVDALNSPLELVAESRGMLTKINFPREALILAGLGEVLFNFFIRAVLLVGILFWYRLGSLTNIIFAPFGVIMIIMLGLMFGILMTPLGILYADVRRGLMFVVQIWFFLTPVIYPLPQTGFALFCAKLNPVTPVLVTTRELMTTGGPVSQLSGFLVVSILTFFFLGFGWLLYRIAMPHLIARMSS